MLRTTVLIALVAPVAAFVSDPSFKVFAKASTAMEATTYCQKDGGTLAPIPNLMVNARLVELAEAIGETQFWTGGRYITSCADRSDDCFEWVGNTNIKFCDNLPNRDNDANCDMWDRKEPNNFLSREECVRANINGRWNDADCTRKHAFACYYPGTSTTWETSTTTWATSTTTLEPTTTTTFETSTTTAEPTSTTTMEPPLWSPTGEEWTNYGSCFYKHFDTKKTWGSAKKTCATATPGENGEGAWLVAPTSESESRFIAAMRQTADPVWTAGTVDSGMNRFSYDSMSWDAEFNVADWSGWYPNEPNGDTTNARCVQQGMNQKNKDTEMWKMNDAQCDEKNRFVCQWCVATTVTTQPETSTTTWETSTTTQAPTTTTLEPTTYELPSDADWQYSDHTQCYYKEYDNRVEFAEAVAACKSAHVAGGSMSHLATISSEAEAMFVAGEAGRPRWVGVYQTNNGEWRNVDASFFSMKFFYDGEPNGGHSHAQMGYRKKKDDVTPWKLNDVPSDSKNPYVCEWCPPELSTSTTTEAPSTTTTIVTSTTTVEPTTTTTDEPGASTSTKESTKVVADEPCVAGSDGLSGELQETDILAKHVETLAHMNTRMDNRRSGKTFPVKWTCPEYCAGLAWGPSCAPCAVGALTTKESCLFPGPFLTGELCHRDFKTREVTEEPCCNLEARTPIGDYNIAEATTCVIGANCNCKKWGPVDSEDRHGEQRLLHKFEASYSYTLPRKFEDGICTEV